jgi:hypothetical protein
VARADSRPSRIPHQLGEVRAQPAPDHGQSSRGTPGAAHASGALLQGLVLCGRCGRRMLVRYGRRSHSIRYRSVSENGPTGASVCRSFGAGRLERAVASLVLATRLEVSGVVPGRGKTQKTNLLEHVPAFRVSGGPIRKPWPAGAAAPATGLPKSDASHCRVPKGG